MSGRQWDEVSFEEFYEQFHPRIVRYLRGKCATLQDAEDLANECFLYCMQHWKDFDAEKASRKTWLYIIVRCRWKNYAQRHVQLHSIDGFEEILPDKDILGQTVWLQTVRNELARLLDELPDMQRTAIVMRYFSESDDQEIAARLGTTTVNVRVLIHRGIKKLNRDFSDYLRMVLKE